ncbi:ComEC/Rec2 family competence protein [Paracoccus aestuariivivens]|uniref:ComEC/Rec2 family competence protein n=1 Tax=Paracoccus aestuariivivens TaxID=1820333 RepID=UPI001478DEE0
MVGIDRSSRDRIRLTLDQLVLDDVAPERVPRRVRVSLFVDDPLPVPGERVMLTAHLDKPQVPAEPGGFDFRRVAWFEHLGAIGYSRTPVMTIAPPDAGGALALHRLRMRLSVAMKEAIGGQAGAVSSAMMTGDRSGIAEHTNEVMRASNLFHIISISGLHMSMLTGFVYAAIRYLGAMVLGLAGLASSRLHKYAAAAAFLSAASYLWLSGGDVATTRSFIMVAVMLIAIMSDRRAISLRTVAVAAVVILVITPEALVSPGFQMSFAATVALILAAEPWQKIAPRLPWWLKPVTLLLVSSLVASISTSPIAAAHFGRVSHYGVFANLLVVPVIGLVVMPCGAIAAVLAPFGLSDLPLWCMGLGAKWMLVVAEYVANTGGATTLIKAPPHSVLPLMGVGAILVVLSPVYGARQIIARRMVGGMAIIVALIMWDVSKRPDVLISSDGQAVGVMTPEGRAVSRPKGGTFAVSEWLAADGSSNNQVASAAIPYWVDNGGYKKAVLPQELGGVEIYHVIKASFDGKEDSFCQNGSFVIMNRPLELDRVIKGECTVLDSDYLKITGAISLDWRNGSILLDGSNGSGDRSWSGGAEFSAKY